MGNATAEFQIRREMSKKVPRIWNMQFLPSPGNAKITARRRRPPSWMAGNVHREPLGARPCGRRRTGAGRAPHPWGRNFRPRCPETCTWRAPGAWISAQVQVSRRVPGARIRPRGREARLQDMSRYFGPFLPPQFPRRSAAKGPNNLDYTGASWGPLVGPRFSQFYGAIGVGSPIDRGECISGETPPDIWETSAQRGRQAESRLGAWAACLTEEGRI